MDVHLGPFGQFWPSKIDPHNRGRGGLHSNISATSIGIFGRLSILFVLRINTKTIMTPSFDDSSNKQTVE